MNNRNLLIRNNTSYSTSDVMEFLCGAPKLEGKVVVKMESGSDDGYDTCSCSDVTPSRMERWNIG